MDLLVEKFDRIGTLGITTHFGGNYFVRIFRWEPHQPAQEVAWSLIEAWKLVDNRTGSRS